MPKYSPVDLSMMAIRLLKARSEGDPRYHRFINRMTSLTGKSRQEIEGQVMAYLMMGGSSTGNPI